MSAMNYPMKRWEILEALFLRLGITSNNRFMNDWVAVQLGVSTTEATEYIQSYLAAQRAKTSNTLFVLKRMPGTRTANAQWAIGQRQYDAKLVTKAFSSDIKCRFMLAIEPDLNRMAAINPQAAQQAQTKINTIVNSVVPLIELVLEN
jgi:hypothetical protein